MFCFLLIAVSIGLPSHSEVVAGELPDVNEETDFGLGINLPNPNIIETIGWRDGRNLLSASGRVLLVMNKEGRVPQINTGRGVPIATIWPSGAQRIFAGANYSYFATADQRVKRVRLSSTVSSSSPEIGDTTDYLKYPEYNI